MTVTNQKYRLAGAAATVMFSMVISRATGFLRSTLIPNLLVKNESDALFAAFSVTNFMYFLLVGGAIAAALIPVLSGYLARDNEKEGWMAVGSFINYVFILMIILSAAGIVFSKQIVDLTATRLNPEAKAAAIGVTRIMFPSVCFIMLAGLTNGVLNSYRRFAAAAYGPAVYNMGTVISLVFLHEYGVGAIAWGIMGSSLFYFLFQFSFAFRNFRYYKPYIFLKHPGFRRLMKLAVPSLLASSVIPLNVLVSQHFASYFSKGSLTAYSNATDIWQLPYGIFAMGMGTALLPALSEKFALGQEEEYCRVLKRGLRTVIFFVVPSAAAFLLLSTQIVSVIYKWSPSFDQKLLSSAANLLVWFTIGLITQSLLAILNRAYYARNDVKTPVLAGVFTLFINIALCYLSVGKARELTGLGGIALAYSLQSLAYAAILLYLLVRKLKSFKFAALAVYFLKVSAASAVMVTVLYIINMIYPLNCKMTFSLDRKVLETAFLAFQVIAGMAVYTGTSVFFGIEEGIDMRNALKIRIVKGFKLLAVRKKEKI